MRTRIRAAVVACDEAGRVLLVRQTPGMDFWVVPGGGLEGGELMREAALREFREETGLQARLVRLLWIDEMNSNETLRVDAIYLGEIIGGAAGDGEHECRFFSQEELDTHSVYPRWLADAWREWRLTTTTGHDPARLPGIVR
ncbi:MAG: NUDIX domain-containing protein [Chloroflexota bacterium]